MINVEQTKVRLRDLEITRLKLENEALLLRVKTLTTALVEILRHCAQVAPYSEKIKLLELATTVEDEL